MRSVSLLTASMIKTFGRKALVLTCLLGCVGFSSVALAQLTQVQKTGAACAGTFNPNLSCVSNDIEINDIAQMTELEGGQDPILSCIEGEKVILDIRLTTLLNANSRYDSLVWIGEEGQNPRGTLGTCYVTSLPDDPDSPFILDLELDGDQCYDTNSSSTAPVDQYLFQVEVDCIDIYSPDPGGTDPDDVIEVPDGELDVFVLITWFQNNTLNCGIGEGFAMTPGVNPKCDAALLLGIDVEVLEASSIQIVKTSSGGGGGTFGYTTDVPGLGVDGAFTLDTTGTNTDSTEIINLTAEQVGQTYSIAETVPDGWALTSATCDNGDTPDAVTPLDGQAVICTFLNAALGSVTIVKETNGGDGSFDFTSNLPGGNFNIQTSGGSEQYSESDVPAGIYDISESVPTGWNLDSATCDDESDPAALDVSDGETVICTFVNTKLGEIIVEKQTLPDGSGETFDFTGSAAGTIGDGGTITVSNLLPGAYSSTEAVPTGWVLTSIICDDVNSSGDGVATANFNVEADEVVRCVFTNTQDGSIEVIKELSDTGPDSQTFDFTSSFNGTFQLIGDGATTTAIPVTPGSGYTVSEDDPTASGWALTGASCGDGSDPLTDIVVSPGEAVVCTFTNTPLGSATVIKSTVGGNGEFFFAGDAPIGPFSLDTTDQFMASTGDLFDFILDAGIYDVTETVPDGWALTSIGCDNESDTSIGTATASMDVALAESVTCTFENTADGTLIIQKQTLPAGSDQSFEFVGDANGFLVDYSVANDELEISGQPGLYSSAELVPEGWALTGINCTGQIESGITTGDTNVLVDLAAGETVICTFENTAQGSITIVKETQGGDGTFTFNRDFGASFDLVSDADNSETFSGLAPGEYMVSEVLKDFWTLGDISCGLAGSEELPASEITIGGAGGFDPGDTGVTIGLIDGESIICTFRNDAWGSISIAKETDPNGSIVEFDFTGEIIASLADGGSTGLMKPAGQYSVTELVPAGWDLTAIDCGVENNSSGDVESATANFDITWGEDVTCTFNNMIQRGNIVVDKVTDPAGSTQSFGFTSNYGDAFSLADGDTPNDSGDLLPSSEATSYNVAEGDVAGWDMTSATCTGEGNTPASINLQPGETVTCTFNNMIQRGNITVDKVTDPAGSLQLFGFTTNYSEPFSLADGDSPNDSGDLLPTSESDVESYSVIEDDIEGWDPISAICLGTDDAVKIPTAIVLEPGETVNCTFINEARAAVTIVKILERLDDGEFCFSVTGPDINDGFCIDTIDGTGSESGDNIPIGFYSITEIIRGEYRLTSQECDNGDSANALTLEPGDDVTCYMVNVPIVTVPVNNPIALLMLILMMLATGWYFRPATMRKF